MFLRASTIAAICSIALSGCQTTSKQSAVPESVPTQGVVVFAEDATLYLSGRTEFDNDWTAVLKPDGTGTYTDANVGSAQGRTWPVTYTRSGDTYDVLLPEDYTWSGTKWKGRWQFVFDASGKCVKAMFTGNRAFQNPSSNGSSCQVTTG